MNERDIAEKVLLSCRSGLPGAVVVKHNDMGTTGIPDIQVARANLTSWGELKFLRKGRTLKGINKAQQLLFCHELATVNNGRCWVLVYEDLGEPLLTVWQPHALFRHLWPRVAGPNPDHPSWKKLGTEPLQLDDWNLPGGLIGALMVHGALRGPWDYDLLARLVKDAAR